jgi:Ca2+-binding RTX toxin-like protein
LGDAASTINGGAGTDVITGGTGNDTLNGQDGNDTITTAAGNDTVTGGAGNDVVNTDSALSALDVITGGDGTDTIAIDVAATAASSVGVSGFERLRIDTAATQDVAVWTANSTFTAIDVNVAGLGTFTNVGAGVDSLFNSATGGSAAVTRLVDAAANSLSVFAQDDLAGTDGVTTIVALTANNEETLNLVSGSNAAEVLTITTLTDADLTTLNLSGTAAVTITNAVASSTALATVDSTGLTGAATVNASVSTVAVTMTAGVGGATFTGGVGADTITGGTAANTLSGGAGNDTIVGGDAADTITGGFGADTMTGGAGVDNFVQTDLHGVTATAVTDVSTGAAMAATVVFAVGDSITYGNGIDVITDFTAGAAGDTADTFVAGAATSLVGVAHDQLNAADDINFLSGSFNATTNTFTITADGLGADTLIVSIDEDVAEAIDSTANAFILQGVDSDDLVAGNFI